MTLQRQERQDHPYDDSPPGGGPPPEAPRHRPPAVARLVRLPPRLPAGPGVPRGGSADGGGDGAPRRWSVLRPPARAKAAAGFDYFSLGVPDKDALEALATRLTDLGEEHAGVHFATIGWILPMLHDPDGHEVRFYTVQHHTEPTVEQVLVVEDAVGTSAQRELEHQS